MALTNLEAALEQRFTSEENPQWKTEIEDIAQYGVDSTPGFIYTEEVEDFFHQHQGEIEDTLHTSGVTPDELVNPVNWGFSELMVASVEYVVRDFCERKLAEIEWEAQQEWEEQQRYQEEANFQGAIRDLEEGDNSYEDTEEWDGPSEQWVKKV